jgi:hypothetical protein
VAAMVAVMVPMAPAITVAATAATVISSRIKRAGGRRISFL